MKLPKGSIARVVEAFENLDLGDPRRMRRLRTTLAKLAKQPMASLPEAMGTDADLEGAYRLINNPAIEPQQLFEALASETAKRANVAGDVLVVHDTTGCAFPGADPKQVGYLNNGKAGFFLHSAMVLDANTWKRPLGVAYVDINSRKQKSKARSKPGFGEEFLRWERGVSAAGTLLESCRSVCHIADREGDSYALLAGMVRDQRSFVVRVSHDRHVQNANDLTQQWLPLREHVKGLTGIFEREVPLSARKSAGPPAAKKRNPPRVVRIAQLSFAATSVVFKAPRYIDASLPKTLRLNVVHVVERNPPANEEAVQWLLFTTLPVETAEQIATVVDNYRARWTIEEFHKALKTGCSYEKRQFDSLPALLNILALSIPIACEILWLRSRARQQPDAPATEVLTEQQLVILRTLGARPLSDQPTVRDALWALAGLGGHHRRNGEPGWLVLYRGMRTLLTAEMGYAAGYQRGLNARRRA
jgi:Transposase DNA-binding/Transposase DDE domain